MITKQLKPGQLYTMKGHIFQCKKNTSPFFRCNVCETENKYYCVFRHFNISWMCRRTFGEENYPKLIK